MCTGKWPYILYLLVLICSCTATLYGQKYTAADSVSIYRLLDQADEEDYEGKLASAIESVNQALELSRQNKMLRGEGFALLKLADLLLKKEGGTDELENYYRKAIAIGEQIKDPFLSGLAYLQRSQQEAQIAEYAQAEKSAQTALAFFVIPDSLYYIAHVYNHLGFIKEKSGAYEKAVAYSLQAISLFEKAGNIKEAANTLGNLAIIYYRLGKKEDALQMFKQSAARRETIQDIKGLAATYGNIVTVYMPVHEDSARKYLALQLSYAEKSGILLNRAQAYTNVMSMLVREKKYAEALEFEKKAIDLYEESGDKVKLATRYISAAGIYNLLDDSVHAEEYFRKAEAISGMLDSKPLWQHLYLQRSNFYKDRNNFKSALENSNLYHVYRDSIINEKTATNIAELQAKYETEKKDNEINRLRTEKQIRQLQIERQAAIIKGNHLEAERKEREILLLTQQQQIKDEGLKLKEEELTRLALQAKSNEQELKIMQQESMLKEKEAEQQRMWLLIWAGGISAVTLLSFVLFGRYRLKQRLKEQQKLLAVRGAISKDLHDEIGSTLTSISILSNVSQQAIVSDPGQAREMLQQISQQSRNMQQNISDIVWSIRPDNEKIEDLEVRMREYTAQTLEPLGIDTRIRFDKTLSGETLPQYSRKDILMIFKEAVNNIVKHSNATEVVIEFFRTGNTVHLTIEDNGIWKQKLEGISSGTGTKSMEQRAANIGGALFVDKGKSRIMLTLPLP